MIEIPQSAFGALCLIGALTLTFAWPLGPRRGKVYRVTHPYYWYGALLPPPSTLLADKSYRRHAGLSTLLTTRLACFFYDRAGGAAMAVFYAVMVEVDPEEEATWNDWHTRQHIPEVLAEPGFVRATKYRLDTANGDWNQYLTIYELASREALDAYLQGEAVTRLRADHYNHFGHCTRLSRMILTSTAAISKPIG